SFCLLIRPPPLPPLFPYTTLFRSPIPAANSMRATYISIAPDTTTHSCRGSFPKIPSDLRAETSISMIMLRKVPRISEIPLVLTRSEEHTSELQSRGHLVCRLLLEK